MINKDCLIIFFSRSSTPQKINETTEVNKKIKLIIVLVFNFMLTLLRIFSDLLFVNKGVKTTPLFHILGHFQNLFFVSILKMLRLNIHQLLCESPPFIAAIARSISSTKPWAILFPVVINSFVLMLTWSSSAIPLAISFSPTALVDASTNAARNTFICWPISVLCLLQFVLLAPNSIFHLYITFKLSLKHFNQVLVITWLHVSNDAVGVAIYLFADLVHHADQYKCVSIGAA